MDSPIPATNSPAEYEDSGIVRVEVIKNPAPYPKRLNKMSPVQIEKMAIRRLDVVMRTLINYGDVLTARETDSLLVGLYTTRELITRNQRARKENKSWTRWIDMTRMSEARNEAQVLFNQSLIVEDYAVVRQNFLDGCSSNFCSCQIVSEKADYRRALLKRNSKNGPGDASTPSVYLPGSVHLNNSKVSLAYPTPELVLNGFAAATLGKAEICRRLNLPEE
ncbi:hypothetical protein B0H17DRAFT_496791 [Mycena rosella]|uniref:Uncharacterized protein n=1 Tax=Mycena rosella TaxID=1033263 RepID=A0AAD7FU53_MYCRO|nr:hypothetical protein B0H17DRAFT_496791 [Mycena rosella]